MRVYAIRTPEEVSQLLDEPDERRVGATAHGRQDLPARVRRVKPTFTEADT